MQDVWTLALHDLHVEKDTGNPEVWRRLRGKCAHTSANRHTACLLSPKRPQVLEKQRSRFTQLGWSAGPKAVLLGEKMLASLQLSNL